MTIGEAVRSIREKLQDSQQAFSNRLGVTVTTVSRWETNRYTPDPDKLAALAHLARTAGLGNIAQALESESSVVWKMLGRDMLQYAWELFVGISSELAAIEANVKPAAMSAGQKRRLHRALESAMQGRETIEKLMALTPGGGVQE